MSVTSLPDNNFPTWLPPLIVKEIRQGLRARVFQIMLIALPACMVLFALLAIIKNQDGDPLIEQETCSFLVYIVLTLYLAVVLPLTAMRNVRNELVTGSSDLLILSNLTPCRIIFNKWSAYMAQGLLAMFTMLPFLIIQYYSGGVDLFENLISLIHLTVLSAILIALTLWIARQPTWIRSIFSGALFIVFVLISRSTLISANDTDDNWVIIIALSLFTPILLLLASRAFAPPSNHISKSIKLALLGIAAMIGAIAFIFPSTMSDTDYWGDLNLPQLLLVIFTLITLLPEAVNPPLFVPAHVAQQNRPFVIRWIHNLFFTPGFVSTSLFSLFYLTLIACISQNAGSDTLGRLGFVWINLTFFPFILLLFKKKLGEWPTIIHIIICGACLALTAIIHDNFDTRLFHYFLPGASLITEYDFYSASKSILFVLLILSCVAIFYHLPAWLRTIKAAKQLH